VIDRACRGAAHGAANALAIGKRTVAGDKSPLSFLLEDADPVEQQARLRELRVLAALILNWNHPLVAELDAAISDPVAVDQALAALACSPAKCKRRILASFGALHGLVKVRVPKTPDVDDGHCPRCGL
jgi:hypothetical protein